METVSPTLGLGLILPCVLSNVVEVRMEQFGVRALTVLASTLPRKLSVSRTNVSNHLDDERPSLNHLSL